MPSDVTHLAATSSDATTETKGGSPGVATTSLERPAATAMRPRNISDDCRPFSILHPRRYRKINLVTLPKTPLSVFTDLLKNVSYQLMNGIKYLSTVNYKPPKVRSVFCN